MEELKQIALNEIHPHPQNPRKDLGDVSELTESIKKKWNHAEPHGHPRSLG